MYIIRFRQSSVKEWNLYTEFYTINNDNFGRHTLAPEKTY